jgi:hypothetical protein
MSTTSEPLEIIENGNLKAWRLDYVAKISDMGFDPALDGYVASWVIQAPWAHPCWFNYWLHVVHLRPIDRGDGPIETIFYLDGATHEIWLYALNPDVPLAEIVSEAKPHEALLDPKNFASQLKLDSDEAAVDLARETACDILFARLNPDTDAIQQWWDRFGDNMRRRTA